MRFRLKTTYNDDIRLFKFSSDMYLYLALIAGLLLLPFIINVYYLSQLTFIAIYSIVAVGLMLLTGYTGQISLGHAAFFAIGAYTSAILNTALVGWFPVTLLLSGFTAAVAGVVIGLPALRLTGLYLAIATMAFNFIVKEILIRWEGLTRGNLGIYVDPASIGGFDFISERSFFYLALAILILAFLSAKNILRSPSGRAFIAIRDSETASQAMGINLAKFKTMAFAISAFFTGVAGSLYAHKLTFINPESFNIGVSIEFLAIIIIGGLGTLQGAILGSIFVLILPQVIIALGPYLPEFLGNQSSLKSGLYGLAIMLIIIFEPEGLYGLWRKLRFYLEMFPLYKKGTFKKKKKFFKTDSH